MILTSIVEYLKNNLVGLFILGISSSIVATLLYNLTQKLYSKILKFFHIKIKISKLKKIMISYGDGFMAGYANSSTYQQIALIGDFIIKVILKTGIIIITFMCFLTLLIVVEKPYSWVFVIVFPAVLTIQSRNLKEKLESYSSLLKMIFGDEFYQAQKTAVKEYVSQKILEKQNKENPNSSKAADLK